jgi:hypothetical protein
MAFNNINAIHGCQRRLRGAARRFARGMMKAVVFKGVGLPLSIETRPDPVPGTEEIVLRVARCGALIEPLADYRWQYT